MEREYSDLARKLRLDVAASVYSEIDIEKNVRIFKEQQEKSLLFRQYGQATKEKNDE